jgi:hypothetical protein
LRLDVFCPRILSPNFLSLALCNTKLFSSGMNLFSPGSLNPGF